MKYEQELNMGGIEYPIKLKDIHKFEAQNPNINIYVFALPNKKKEKESKEYFLGLYNIYKTKFPERQTEQYRINNPEYKEIYDINLLYIEQDGNSHYCLINTFLDYLVRIKRKAMFVEIA